MSNDFEILNESTEAPAISFLMPIFQQEDYIRESLLSALRQKKVVVELIVSDDASADKTYEIARSTIEQHLAGSVCHHRILLRKGRERLRRDHLALLIDQARCDLVCQAHGDDLFHPQRAAKQVEIFAANKKITLISVGSGTIDGKGDIKAPPAAVPENGPYGATRYNYDQIIRGDDRLIGFCQAWRRSAVAQFERLDSQVAAVSHDRILPFRAALAGQVWHIEMDLVVRRVHRRAWSRLMFAEPQGKRKSFGWNLCSVSALTNMLKDTRRALDLGLISEERFWGLARTIDELRLNLMEAMLSGFRTLTQEGKQIAWVDEETLIQLRESGKI